MRTIDPDLLRTYLAIVETGSYGAAARQVNKTQSTVSAQMKRLEEVLGVPLFEKDGRRNAVTDAGHKLIEYARSIVRLNDEAIGAFRPPAISGKLMIGTSDDYAQAFLPAVLGRFARLYADVEVQIVTANTDILLRSLDEGDFDAVIASVEHGRPGLIRLRSDQLHWLGAERGNAHLRDPLPLALWPDGCAWRALALTALAEAGRNWRVVQTTSNAPLLAAAVREGLGITIGPPWHLAPGLRILDELDRACPLGMVDVGIKTRNGPHSAPLAAFIEHLQSSLRGGAPAPHEEPAPSGGATDPAAPPGLAVPA